MIRATTAGRGATGVESADFGSQRFSAPSESTTTAYLSESILFDTRPKPPDADARVCASAAINGSTWAWPFAAFARSESVSTAIESAPRITREPERSAATFDVSVARSVPRPTAVTSPVSDVTGDLFCTALRLNAVNVAVKSYPIATD